MFSNTASRMVSRFHLLGLVVTLGALTEGVIVPFQDCGSTLGHVGSMDFDCDGGTASPCQFTKGKTYQGKIALTPNKVINNGTIVLHAIIGGATLPFPLTDNDMCKSHGLTCPLKANQEVNFEMEIKAPSYAPAVHLVVKLEIQTHCTTNIDLMCAEFLGSVVAG